MTGSENRTRLFNIANLLTMFRIVLVPVVLVLLLMLQREPELGWIRWETEPVSDRNFILSIIAAILFVVASLTDILDGYMARKYQLITNFGKLLDPLADKLLVMGAMVMLVEKNRLPGWMAVIILGRELAITSLRSIAGAEGVVIAASQLGRWKNVFQVSSITAIILYYHIGWVNFYILGITLFMLAVLMTIWSGVDYTYHFWPLIIGKQPQKKD